MQRTIRFFIDFGNKLKKDNLASYAAQSAYFIILSIIPLGLLLCSIANATPSLMNSFNSLLASLLPEVFAGYVESTMIQLMEDSFGLVSFTAIAAVVAASKAFMYLAVGFNVIYGLTDTRNYFVQKFWSIIYTLLFIIGIGATLFLTVFASALQKLFIGRFPVLEWLINLNSGIRILFVFLMMCLFFTLLLQVLPCQKMRFIEQLPGGVLCSMFWFAFSQIITIWVNIFNGFSMYGSMTTIMIILIWLYVCMYFLLLCAELNCVCFSKFYNKRT